MTAPVTVDQIQQPVNVQTEENTSLNVQTNEETVLNVREVEKKTETLFVTGEGDIHLIHEITLGDVVVSTMLMAILIFQILNRFIRR